MKRLSVAVLFAGLWSFQASGAVIYSNVTSDAGDTLPLAAFGFTQIGDQLQLVGTARSATQASVEFFNAGSAGTFDATLRFFQVGPSAANPVGLQIGGDFTRTGIAAPATNGATGFVVSFALPSLLLPDNVIFTIAVANQSSGLDIVGLDYYNGPLPGNGVSDGTYAIANNGSNFLQTGSNNANLYFELLADDVTNIPEPATTALAGAALAGLLFARRLRS